MLSSTSVCTSEPLKRSFIRRLPVGVHKIIKCCDYFQNPVKNIIQSRMQYFNMIIKILICVLVSVIMENDSANILGVFPTPSISHQVVFRKITRELANRGHHVTVITPDPAYPKGSAPQNYTEIDVHDVSYKILRKFYEQKLQNDGVFAFKTIRNVSSLLKMILQSQFQTKKVQELVSKKIKFDLILVESIVRPALAYSYIFKAPVIFVSSFNAIFSNHKTMGSPTHPLLYPSSTRTSLYNLSLIEKIRELYTHYTNEYADYLNEQDENPFLKEIFGPECPTIHDLSKNVHMLMLNIHPIWADNQPVAPNVIYMGGIHQVPEKELPKDLKNYLDLSRNGVIYVSFGTNVLAETIPQEKILTMIKVLSKYPYNILWKWDQDELPRKSNNIKTSKWLPQSDLLRHPNIKLFITQAGLQSTDEAITAGVPLVAIPMLADQWYNAEKYEKFGLGIKLDIDSLTEEQFHNAIQTVIEDESYRRNIIKLRNIMNDQPETPLNRTMWWIEYVLRHQGAKHLQSPAANLSYAEYFEYEVILVILSSVIIFLSSIVLMVIFISKLFTDPRKVKTN